MVSYCFLKKVIVLHFTFTSTLHFEIILYESQAGWGGGCSFSAGPSHGPGGTLGVLCGSLSLPLVGVSPPADPSHPRCHGSEASTWILSFSSFFKTVSALLFCCHSTETLEPCRPPTEHPAGLLQGTALTLNPGVGRAGASPRPSLQALCLVSVRHPDLWQPDLWQLRARLRHKPDDTPAVACVWARPL